MPCCLLFTVPQSPLHPSTCVRMYAIKKIEKIIVHHYSSAILQSPFNFILCLSILAQDLFLFLFVPLVFDYSSALLHSQIFIFKSDATPIRLISYTTLLMTDWSHCSSVLLFFYHVYLLDHKYSFNFIFNTISQLIERNDPVTNSFHRIRCNANIASFQFYIILI